MCAEEASDSSWHQWLNMEVKKSDKKLTLSSSFDTNFNTDFNIPSLGNFKKYKEVYFNKEYSFLYNYLKYYHKNL